MRSGNKLLETGRQKYGNLNNDEGYLGGGARKNGGGEEGAAGGARRE